MATPDDWSRVMDDADDETVLLMLKLQLDDIAEIEQSSPNNRTEDEQSAFRRYKAELQHHQALRTIETENDTPSSPPVEPTPAQEVPTFECVVCSERFDADHAWRAPCSHWYCDEHLCELFQLSITDQTLFPPKCCRQEIPFDDVKITLAPELSAEFDSKQEELIATRGNTGTYCYVPTCSTFIRDDEKVGTIGTCSGCGEQTCVLCKHELHEGDCVEDEAQRQTEQLAQQNNWQRCPQCRRLVELNIGCNHMTCLCGGQFCYVCGREWKNCPCPQFAEANLLHRANEIGQREGRRDIAAVAENLRANHDCGGNHAWQFVRGGHRCDECTARLPTFIFRC